VEWKKIIEDQNRILTSSLYFNFERIREKKLKLDSKRPLPTIALNRLKNDLFVEWSYNSNAIEGNTLSLNETRIVLEDGMTIKGKSLKEHLEVSNHHDAIFFLEKLIQKPQPITERVVLDLHEIVMLKIEKEFAGRYRNGQVRIGDANFVPPNALKIDALIEDWIDYINTNPHKLNDIVLSAILHHRFVWIHPFFDGNGRTIRLLMNLFLMQEGYPPAIILKTDRKKYYSALNQANNGNFEKLVILICQAIERSLDIYLMAYPDGDEYLPISNIVQEPEIEYGQEYVSLLARRGKIDAFKDGKDWYTSKKAILEYTKYKSKKRSPD
jgi:Fic family protein